MARTGHWERIAQNNILQRSSVCVAAVKDNVYVFGGELTPRQPRDNEVHKISPASGQPNFNVTSIPPTEKSPTPRVGAATTMLNQRIYLFSGRGGEAMVPIEEHGSLWVFTAANCTWSSLEPSTTICPQARSYHCMANDGKDTIYVHAGCPEKGRLSDLWAFSVSKAEWKELASSPDPPRGGASLAYVDGKLFRLNGFDGSTEQGGSLDIFDTDSNSWTSLEYSADGIAGPGARSVSTLVPIRTKDDTVLVTMFGESDPSALGHQGAGKMLGDVWAYSLRDSRWAQVVTATDVVPQGRGWFGADVLTVDGAETVIVAGGLGENNERLDDAWILALK